MATARNFPRNHFSIPVERVRRGADPVFHDRLYRHLLTGTIDLAVETLRPVHVGSGSFGIFRDQLVKEVARQGGRPVIPGSSIKGVCRQTYEVLTSSAAPFDESYNKRRQQPLSAAAALFGALGYQGRVSFDDALLPEDVEPVIILLSGAYPPRQKKGRRFYGRMPAGADQRQTVPALALPEGLALTATLRFRNLNREEVGGVLLSLGVDHFTPRLGGGKYDDYGWVRFRVRRYRLRQGLAFGVADWQDDEGAVADFTRECLAACQLSTDGEASLKTLVNRLQAPVSGRSAREVVT